MKKLGQHFLKNKAALRLIVKALDLQSDEMIIEIGPGHGELTIPLAEACAEKNCKLTAVEKDEKFITPLTTKKIDVRLGDVLEILPQLANQPYKLVGNIPYYITGHLLRVVSELEQKPKRCVFTIQKEVAERIIAAPPRMNRLAASVQFWAQPKILKILPAADFSPPPKVDSAIIELVVADAKITKRERENYYATVRTIFAQPRKTVVNNIGKKNKAEVIRKLQKIGVEPDARPQNLSIENIKAIGLGILSE